MKKPFVILVVDDNPGDARLFQTFSSCHKPSCEIHFVPTGNQASDFLHKKGKHSAAPTPDLMLLDLHLPVIDGATILQRVKVDERFRELPVVVWSNSRTPQEVKEAYRLGASSFIAKPLELERLKETIDGIEHYWMRIATLPSRV